MTRAVETSGCVSTDLAARPEVVTFIHILRRHIEKLRKHGEQECHTVHHSYIHIGNSSALLRRFFTVTRREGTLEKNKIDGVFRYIITELADDSSVADWTLAPVVGACTTIITLWETSTVCK